MAENTKLLEGNFKDNKTKMEKCLINVIIHQKQIIDKIVNKFKDQSLFE